jgi:hypothetical protein
LPCVRACGSYARNLADNGYLLGGAPVMSLDLLTHRLVPLRFELLQSSLTFPQPDLHIMELANTQAGNLAKSEPRDRAI